MYLKVLDVVLDPKEMPENLFSAPFLSSWVQIR